MTQGNIKTINYYTIKIGGAFLKEFKKGSNYGFADEKPSIRKVSLSGREDDAYKWYFDNLMEAGEEEEFHQEINFVETLKMLEDNGMICKVLKTTTVTTKEQKEVSFVDGKEKVSKPFNADYVFNIVSNTSFNISDVEKFTEDLMKHLSKAIKDAKISR